MNPWLTALLTLGPGLIQMLFGQNKAPTVTQQQKTDQTITETPKGYKSPLLGLVDPFMADTLLRQVRGFSGAGMPGGKGDLSPYFAELLELINTELPLILEGYTKNGTTSSTNLQKRKLNTGG